MGEQMLTLSGKVINVRSEKVKRQIYSLTSNKNLPNALKSQKALLMKDGVEYADGFGHYIVYDIKRDEIPNHVDHTVITEEFYYLDDEDIVAIDGNDRLRSLYRSKSDHNTFLLTEQCNNFCLMCSQPPKKKEDRWLLDEAFEAIRLIPRSAATIGITGGEPTLYGNDFIKLINHFKSWLPNTALHILSNGRAFADYSFAKKYADVNHQDVMIGIPIYSYDAVTHDYVVQAKGAFDETIRGVLNLKKLNQRVEIRVVIHKQTYKDLVELAEYIGRNLLFVDQVALMGLEMMGFTRSNLDLLWIDPLEYKDELSKAVSILKNYGINVLVFNHQLCLVNKDIEPYYVKSISDWKNEYAKECDGCLRKEECGGFFSSSIKYKYSSSINPFT
jgi:His-Xaa-Ser system radical SAM maturase HxsC